MYVTLLSVCIYACRCAHMSRRNVLDRETIERYGRKASEAKGLRDVRHTPCGIWRALVYYICLKMLDGVSVVSVKELVLNFRHLILHEKSFKIVLVNKTPNDT